MLTRGIAESIVNETSKRINRNVNIMNKNGVIIASCDETRINTIHDGALEVLETGEAIYIYPEQINQWKKVKPGINLPIEFQNEIIGVIGITGHPAELEEIGRIIKMTTELMINQEYLASKLEWKQRIEEMIIEQLIKKNPDFNEIERGLSRLDIKLTPAFLTILIEISHWAVPVRTITNNLTLILENRKYLKGFISTNRILILINDYHNVEPFNIAERIFHSLKTLKLKFRMSYSLPFKEISKFRQSYLDCEMALKISGSCNELIPFVNVEAKALIFNLEKEIAERYAERILQNLNETQIQTLEVFFENDLNIEKAAEALYLHRNTLIYRLTKITEETGLNPRNFYDALNFQIAIWIQKKRKNSDLEIINS